MQRPLNRQNAWKRWPTGILNQMSTGSPPHAKLLSGACLHVCVAAGLRVNGNTHFEVVHDEVDVRGEVLGQLLREVEALLALLLRDAGLVRARQVLPRASARLHALEDVLVDRGEGPEGTRTRGQR